MMQYFDDEKRQQFWEKGYVRGKKEASGGSHQLEDKLNSSANKNMNDSLQQELDNQLDNLIGGASGLNKAQGGESGNSSFIADPPNTSDSQQKLLPNPSSISFIDSLVLHHASNHVEKKNDFSVCDPFKNCDVFCFCVGAGCSKANCCYLANR